MKLFSHSQRTASFFHCKLRTWKTLSPVHTRTLTSFSITCTQARRISVPSRTPGSLLKWVTKLITNHLEVSEDPLQNNFFPTSCSKIRICNLHKCSSTSSSVRKAGLHQILHKTQLAQFSRLLWAESTNNILKAMPINIKTYDPDILSD
jgi:hypothetical protein